MVFELEAAGIKHTPIGPDISSRHGSRLDWLANWISEYSASNPPIGCVLVGYVHTPLNVLPRITCAHSL